MEIILQKFDENFEDYFDSEQGAYIVYAGKFGLDDFKIATVATIVDYDNASWDCWLKSAEYIPSINAYELTYKPY